MIQAYFNRIKAIVDPYTRIHFVLDANVSFEMRSGEQGHLVGSITFADGSVFYFREFLDAVEETVDKLMYVYHYQNADNQLIFRYDNARHRPALRFLEHKHLPGQIVEALAPALDAVLTEIVIAKGWI